MLKNIPYYEQLLIKMERQRPVLLLSSWKPKLSNIPFLSKCFVKKFNCNEHIQFPWTGQRAKIEIHESDIQTTRNGKDATILRQFTHKIDIFEYNPRFSFVSFCHTCTYFTQKWILV